MLGETYLDVYSKFPYVFVLSVQIPGIINLLEEALLVRVEKPIETTWKMLHSELTHTSTSESHTSTSGSEEAIKMEKLFVSLAESMKYNCPVTILCVGKAGVEKVNACKCSTVQARIHKVSKEGVDLVAVIYSITNFLFSNKNIRNY